MFSFIYLEGRSESWTVVAECYYPSSIHELTRARSTLNIRQFQSFYPVEIMGSFTSRNNLIISKWSCSMVWNSGYIPMQTPRTKVWDNHDILCIGLLGSLMEHFLWHLVLKNLVILQPKLSPIRGPLGPKVDTLNTVSHLVRIMEKESVLRF